MPTSGRSQFKHIGAMAPQWCGECEDLGDADVQAHRRRDKTYGERQAVQTQIDAEIAAR
jgi:hypothetical protein